MKRSNTSSYSVYLRINPLSFLFLVVFENKYSPFISYKYNKHIYSAIFSINKLVTELDIETTTPDS